MVGNVSALLGRVLACQLILLPYLSAADRCTPPPSALTLISDPLITQAIHRRVAGMARSVAEDGASTLSREWRAGQRKDWFIENQRGGADLVEAGVVLHDHKLVDAGLRELEWGYARQTTDGSFLESGDAFHSVSIFIVDSGRSLLALREQHDEFPDFMSRVDRMIPQLTAAARWMLHPDVLEAGKRHDAPYTHRKWILAAALGIAAQLGNDPKLAVAAREFAREGIALQHEDGLNPEKGGFDVSYQMVDALNGSRYYTTLNCDRDAELMGQVRRMIIRTCQWEMQRISADGEIEVAGSTRMLKETGRGGTVKHTNYKEIVQSFVSLSKISGDSAFYEIARKLARNQKWIQ
jgi:hypothetical protein